MFLPRRFDAFHAFPRRTPIRCTTLYGYAAAERETCVIIMAMSATDAPAAEKCRRAQMPARKTRAAHVVKIGDER